MTYGVYLGKAQRDGQGQRKAATPSEWPPVRASTFCNKGI